MDLLKEYEIQPFIKYVVLKVDIFESEIIDERNFGIDEEFAIMKFKPIYHILSPNRRVVQNRINQFFYYNEKDQLNRQSLNVLLLNFKYNRL